MDTVALHRWFLQFIDIMDDETPDQLKMNDLNNLYSEITEQGDLELDD